MGDSTAALAKMPRLVAGLGNPGREYARTRHNAGFLALDLLAARHGVRWEESRPWKAKWARTPDGVILLQPWTYMNLSGEAVGTVARFYKIEPEEVLVVSDDTALPLGRLRLRPGGSDGGHNGLASVAQHLGTIEYPRLRIGVGAASPGEMVSHVLGGFRPEEQAALDESLVRAAEAAEVACREGVSAAMNRFNAPPAPPRPKKPRPPRAPAEIPAADPIPAATPVTDPAR